MLCMRQIFSDIPQANESFVVANEEVWRGRHEHVEDENYTLYYILHYLYVQQDLYELYNACVEGRETPHKRSILFHPCMSIFISNAHAVSACDFVSHHKYVYIRMERLNHISNMSSVLQTVIFIPKQQKQNVGIDLLVLGIIGR